jgi:type IV pilus assembly protein PilC
MPIFTYTARDRSGAQTSGTLTAASIGDLRSQLRAKNLFVTDAREQNGTGQAQTSSIRRQGVKLGDMVVMSRQLATLVRAGLNITECLYSVAEQTENHLLKDTLDQVRLDVLTGSTLGGAMRKHPRIFNEMYTSLVEAGETGGMLDKTLETAAEQFSREADLREKVKAAFTYPALVMLVAVGVVTFMLIVIVPVFAGVYKDFHAELPAITQSLVFVSAVIVHDWWGVLITGILTVTALRRYLRTDRGRRQYDTLKLTIPLLGKLNRKIAVSRFTRTFAGMTSAGVPILRALAISGTTSGNVIIQDAVMDVAEQVQQGTSLAMPMEQTKEFPLMVTRLIAVGEQSGNLDEMLNEITLFYNSDIQYTVEKLTKLMEPLMTIVVGVIVLFILLALYMPIFSLGQVVRR